MPNGQAKCMHRTALWNRVLGGLFSWTYGSVNSGTDQHVPMVVRGPVEV